MNDLNFRAIVVYCIIHQNVLALQFVLDNKTMASYFNDGLQSMQQF